MKHDRYRFIKALAVYVMLFSLSIYFYLLLAAFLGLEHVTKNLFAVLVLVVLIGVGLYFLPRAAK